MHTRISSKKMRGYEVAKPRLVLLNTPNKMELTTSTEKTFQDLTEFTAKPKTDVMFSYGARK